jgi:predicted aspartyl protease
VPVYSHSYNNKDYFPAAPIVEIAISSSSRGASEATLIALVDSGADATMIPVDILTAINSRYLETRQMRTVTGQVIPVSMHRVHIRIGPYRLTGLRVVAVQEGSEPIVGRDVLNELEITLIGPAQELWVA